ncbi:MAG: hypothetical protein JSU65_12755 [Candidatus Zixiibacteriota bacterium]|nr:MAG: hypothetical protein JSU65_12755 [candidate division Zixibacteria bacterium]
MPGRKLHFLWIIAPVCVFLLPSAYAQESATIQATASVSTTLSISGTQDLRFGVVTPGVNKPVDKTTIGSAGEWYISGTANAEISMTFTLPDSLQHTTNPVGMNVAFAATDASFDDGSGGGQAAPVGVLNPNAGNAERLGVTGIMTVWIGGTVFPSVSQSGGDYSSDVVLTVAYTGS